MEDINPKRAIPAALFVACAVGIAVFGKSQLTQKSSNEKRTFPASSRTAQSESQTRGSREKTPESSKYVVEIGGAIMRPGLYEVEKGTRVEQLIALAGGVFEGADFEKVNRAALLKDGEKVTIPYSGAKFVPFRSSNTSKGASDTRASDRTISQTIPAPTSQVESNSSLNDGVATPPVTQPSFPLSVNAATREQLELLPGVGPALAGRIIEYRDGIGGFKSIDELDKVRGIGPALLEKIRPYLSL
jgi:competence protein ComEA